MPAFFDKLMYLAIVMSILFQVAGCEHRSDHLGKAQQYERTLIKTTHQEKRGMKLVRSRTQTADGYANLSKDRTRLEARREAIENAKKKVVEEVRENVEPSSEGGHFEIKDVRILEQRDHGVDDSNRYHVWIKAEVAYELNLKSGALNVNVWPSKEKYRVGENIEIHIRGNRDCHAQIFNIKPGGKRIPLVPNEFRKLNFIFKAGKTYSIPDPRIEKFEFKAMPPYGENLIYMYVSEEPFDKLIHELQRNDIVPAGWHSGECKFTVEND